MPLVPHYSVTMLSAFLPLNHLIGLLNSTFYGNVRFLDQVRVAFIPNRGINEVVKCHRPRALSEESIDKPHTLPHM